MSAGYRDLHIEASDGAVCVRFTLENRGWRAWPSGTVSVGCQVYDPLTGAFISEGAWIPIEPAVGPGQACPAVITTGLPLEDGSYQLWISPRTEDLGWFHQSAMPFVISDVAVSGGSVHAAPPRIATLAQLRRKSGLHYLRVLLVEPLAALARNRRLIASMTRREIVARYRGSLAGLLWTLLQPLLLMAAYFFVFAVVLQARFAQDPSRSGFVLYFLAGMLPWLAFSEPVARSPVILLESRNVIKRLVFPVEILPANPAVAGLFTEAFALALFLGLLLALRGSIPATSLWLPALLVPQLLLTLGLCWLLAALGVFLRDLGQVIGLALTLLFFLTPICYPVSQLPSWAALILQHSPLYQLVAGYRACLLDGQAPSLSLLLPLWLAAGAAFVIGHACFRKLRPAFPDAL